MLRVCTAVLGASLMLGACAGEYAVRSVPRIAAEHVGKPVSELQEVFGDPRKVESTPTKELYVWFLPAKPRSGSGSGLHGCEMEVSVDPRSQHVLGYTLSNIGWSNCSEVERRVRLAQR